MMMPVVIAIETFWQVVRKWYEGFLKTSERLVLVGEIEPSASSLNIRVAKRQNFRHSPLAMLSFGGPLHPGPDRKMEG